MQKQTIHSLLDWFLIDIGTEPTKLGYLSLSFSREYRDKVVMVSLLEKGVKFKHTKASLLTEVEQVLEDLNAMQENYLRYVEFVRSELEIAKKGILERDPLPNDEEKDIIMKTLFNTSEDDLVAKSERVRYMVDSVFGAFISLYELLKVRLKAICDDSP